jgi:hypothetical protein
MLSFIIIFLNKLTRVPTILKIKETKKKRKKMNGIEELEMVVYKSRECVTANTYYMMLLRSFNV